MSYNQIYINTEHLKCFNKHFTSNVQQSLKIKNNVENMKPNPIDINSFILRNFSILPKMKKI